MGDFLGTMSKQQAHFFVCVFFLRLYEVTFEGTNVDYGDLKHRLVLPLP